MLLDYDSFLKNIEQIQKLFLCSFNREISKEFLIWRYANNPFKDTLFSVKYVDQQIISSYSASPCYLNIAGENKKTAISMTTMTHPIHRGEGIFPKLAHELYISMEDKGYYMIWGFPNNNSHRKFIKNLEWQDIYEIPTMVLDLNKHKNEEKIKYDTDNYFDLTYNNAKSFNEFVSVFKDKNYLKWRYAKNPFNKYTNIIVSNGNQVSSYAVIKKYNQSLDLVDCRAENYEEGEYLIKSTIAYAQQNSLRFINCWAPRHHFIHNICEKHGFLNSVPITYFGGRLLRDSSNKKDFFNYSNWYIQMGDSDVY